MQKQFEFLEHTADIKFKAFGVTLNEAFESVVAAISSYISGNQPVSPAQGKTISVSGSDIESLLYNFVEEIIYLMDAKDFLVSKAEVILRGNNLQATLYGDKCSNYKESQHIKSPTYAEMHIKKIKDVDNKKSSDLWEIQMVLDV